MTVLLIHGFTASPNNHWYRAIGPLLKSAGLKYLAPAMPDSGHPQSAAWLATIKQAFDQTTDAVVLVGHSLGTRAVLLFLEQFEVNVAAALLIGAFSNDLTNGQRRGSDYGSFFDHEIDLNLVKLHCPNFVVMHSRDDQSIPYEQGEKIATDLGAELIAESGYGHFTAPSDASIISTQILKMVHG